MRKSAQRGAQDLRNAATRAADTDRIQVAQLLTDAAAQGQLQLSDYEDRLTKAYAAQTYEELDRLRSDLLGRGLRLRQVARGSNHLRTVRRQCPRSLNAESCGDTGYEHPLSAQIDASQHLIRR